MIPRIKPHWYRPRPLAHRLLVPLLAGCVTGSALATDDPPCSTPIFADWSLTLLEWVDGLTCEEQSPYDDYVPCEGFTYIPHPGGSHGWPATNVRTTCSYDRLIAVGAPTAVMIRNRNCPFPYDTGGITPSPDTIDEVLDYVPDMDFVFMDLEGNNIIDVYPNMVEVVNRARAVNPDIRLGNYAYFPGVYDGSMPFENQADRTNNFFGADLNEQYLTSGVDVAMPHCYPYEYYEVHDNPNHYSGTAPNVRFALFWAPLERLSVAKRDLPSGHLLMPWVSSFIPWTGYEAPEPPADDLAALVQHFRLRGSDAFYTFPGQHPEIDHESYRPLVRDAWLALDEHFDIDETPAVLRLETSKEKGVEWSGISTSERVVILGSNLSGLGTSTIMLPPPTSVPVPESVEVADGKHALFVFDVNCPADYDGNQVVNLVDLLFLLVEWGPCPTFPCYGDINGDSIIGVAELLAVLSSWGPC